MTSRELPASVRTLIEQHIPSALDLEVLLTLHRDERAWQPGELARELRSDPTATERALRKLAEARILAVDGQGYVHRPSSPDLARAVDELADAYARRRVRVIEYIYKRPSERVTTFADAFRLRRDG
jgi:DNA-binding MarR family transcriptional regulator